MKIGVSHPYFCYLHSPMQRKLDKEAKMGRFYNDTVAAISTAMSDAGIGIVRMSGPEAFLIADRVYRGKRKKLLSEQRTHTIHYGYVMDGECMVDEVLVMLMRGPHSFTGEDTVAIIDRKSVV